MKKYFNQKGQILLEIILAILIGAIIIGSATNLIVVSQKSSQLSGDKNVAIFLAQEGIEAIKSISQNSWNDIYLVPNGKGESQNYCLDNDGYSWNLSNISTKCDIQVNDKTYTRTIKIYNVNRDFTSENKDIKTDNSGTEDPSTQKIKVTVTYKNGPDIILEKYISRWKNEIFIQSDWSGGSGQTDFLDHTKYDIDDGNISSIGTNIKLKPL